MPILEVSGLSGGYGETDVLHDVSFTVDDGGITTILGANGAGKTSVLRALCGMLKSVRGNIVLDQKQVVGMATESIVRLGVGHVPDGRGT